MALDYRTLAERYRPRRIRVLFIAESPPAASSRGKEAYFFLEDSPGSEVFLATLVEALYDEKYRQAPGRKVQFLRRFQDDGYYWLLDAVESPINRVGGRPVPEAQRAQLIRDAIPSLIDRLEGFRDLGVLRPETGLILIKKLVFETLAVPLVEAGFTVLNDAKIDFPKYQGDRDTIRGVQRALVRLAATP